MSCDFEDEHYRAIGASLAYHHYDSDAGQGLGGGAANPGLVEFAH